MQNKALDMAPTPPLRVLWRSGEALIRAAVTGGALYGMTPDGFIAALAPETGALRWKSTAAYLPGRLAADGTNIYVLQSGVGLIALTDGGSSYTEQVLYEMPDLENAIGISQPVPIGATVHLAVGGRLLAISTAGAGLHFEVALTGDGPHSLMPLEDDLLTVSGTGAPTRWRAGAPAYSKVWASPAEAPVNLAERAALAAGDRLIVAGQSGVVAYNKGTGARLWARNGIGNLAFAARGASLYCAGDQAALWALRLADGATLWDRQHLAFVSHTPRLGLAVGERHLWVGAALSDGFEPAALWAVDLEDGNFAWQATGVSLFYGNGLPLVAGGRLYTYGTTDPLTAMADLEAAPGVRLEQIKQTPTPLRGDGEGFNPVEVSLRLDVAAKVAFIAWHERDVRNNAVGPIAFQPGRHTINYDARWPRGWTDINQFGRLAFDIEETGSGVTYSQVLLVPVNTLPDIQHHWARRSIETMLYHKYIGGYPDLTFRPDNLVTRAESCSIIAKTLGLKRPSPGFRTKFTDIAGHWARNAIIALEEREIIGGFREADGTYTFRPDTLMTRAQEARLLVKAYEIPPAPAGFKTRFTDIAGHWAKGDIAALEAGGFVNGFQENDGSFTFRPERNLTRAELCTTVVRIRNLFRP